MEFAKQIEPSERGELEITDLNNMYLKDGTTKVQQLGRGFAWFDTGTPNSFMEAAEFVKALEHRQGMKVCCPEEIAFEQEYISVEHLDALGQALKKSTYGRYLMALAEARMQNMRLKSVVDD